MGQFETNVIRSFKEVKKEIENLQHQISELKQKVEDVDGLLLKKERTSANKKAVKKKTSKKKKK